MCGKSLFLWLLALLLACSPAGACGEDLTDLPSGELLKRAVELSRELRTLNERQVQELRASGEISENLQRELAELQSELTQARTLAEASREELRIVSELLNQAGKDLGSLRESWESLSAEAGRLARQRTVYKWLAIGGAVIGAAGVVYGLTR